MEDEVKEAFDRLMSNIENKRDFLQESFSPSYKKSKLELSVYELADLAGLRIFNTNYDKFNLTKKKGQLIRAYFQGNIIEKSINELYDLYSDIFSGEPRWRIDPSLIGSHVPTYDETEIEN